RAPGGCPRLLVGGGCYSDDVNLPGQAYACFVRSPHPHALIRQVDTAAALATPGIIAVLTGQDAAADGVKPLTHSPMPGNPHEDMIRSSDVAFIAPHPPIPPQPAPPARPRRLRGRCLGWRPAPPAGGGARGPGARGRGRPPAPRRNRQPHGSGARRVASLRRDCFEPVRRCPGG